MTYRAYLYMYSKVNIKYNVVNTLGLPNANVSFVDCLSLWLQTFKHTL